MVEFGLKLEDNKVKKWSDKYIDYEYLKELLQRVQDTHKALANSEKKHSAILGAHRHHDDLSVNALPPRNVERKSTINFIDEHTNLLHDDNSSLNPTNQGSGYKSTDGKVSENGSIRRTLSSASLSSNMGLPMKRTMSELSLAFQGVFKKSGPNESLIITRHEALKQLLVERTNQFSNKIRDELNKIQSFYNEQTEYLDSSFDYLDKTVADAARKMDKSRANSQSFSDSETLLIESQGTGTNSLTRSQRNSLKIGLNRTISKRLYKARSSKRIVGKMLGLVDAASESENEDEDDDKVLLRNNSDSIKRSIKFLYRDAKLLRNYASINYTGFVKIIKKFDKKVPDQKGFFKKVFDDQNISFQDGTKIDKLIFKLEKAFAGWFCDGNMNVVRASMLPKLGDSLEMDWGQLRLGYRLGMCAILTVWVCWDCVWGLVRDGNSSIGGRVAFPVFRCCGCLVILHWCWGASVFLWNRYRINYIYLFEFDPRLVRRPLLIFNDAVDETLVFLLLMLLYYKAGADDIPDIAPPGIYPFLLVLYTLKRLIFPLQVKGKLWKDIRSVVAAPITPVTFFHSYIADVFTSMVKVFQDMAWSTCYILSGDFLVTDLESEYKNWQKEIWYKNILIPLICLLPLWIRFFQCLRKYADTGKRWPNLANATKYAFSQTVTLFGAFHPLYLMKVHELNGGTKNLFQIFWFGMFIISSLFSYCWDIFMDWGLGRPKYNFLGPQLMFPKHSTYYQVMFADLFLRSMWVLSLIPPNTGAKFEFPSYLSFVTAVLELLRRTMWGLFRLEHEQKSNTTGYRRVEFVPLHFSTAVEHKYKRDVTHRGKSVLAEVGIVTFVVCGVCVTSIISAQRNNPDFAGEL